jgi:hypothetical protein
MDGEARRREPDALLVRVLVVAGARRVAAARLPRDALPVSRHLVLALVPAERDAQLRVVAVRERPLADLVRDRHRVVRVDARVALLRAVGRVEEDAGQADAGGDRRPDDAVPISAADPHAAQAVRRRSIQSRRLPAPIARPARGLPAPLGRCAPRRRELTGSALHSRETPRPPRFKLGRFSHSRRSRDRARASARRAPDRGAGACSGTAPRSSGGTHPAAAPEVRALLVLDGRPVGEHAAARGEVRPLLVVGGVDPRDSPTDIASPFPFDGRCLPWTPWPVAVFEAAGDAPWLPQVNVDRSPSFLRALPPLRRCAPARADPLADAPDPPPSDERVVVERVVLHLPAPGGDPLLECLIAPTSQR